MSLKRSVLPIGISLRTLLSKEVKMTKLVSVPSLLFSIGYQAPRPRWSWKTGTSCSCSVPSTSTASSRASPSTWRPRSGPGALSSAWRESRVCCQQNMQEAVDCLFCLRACLFSSACPAYLIGDHRLSFVFLLTLPQMAHLVPWRPVTHFYLFRSI